MQSFESLARQFISQFAVRHFPEQPSTLYEPNEYFLNLGGKRVRPVACLMGNELFENILPDAWQVANAIELFHNFTLIHDDIMDKSPVRRGKPTLHEKYDQSTAILAGDVMLVFAYEYLNKIGKEFLHKILHLFNKTAREVCEGQQLDMDYEKRKAVTLEEYIRMIELKTSVLLAASLQMGAILGGAGERNQQLLYEFGRKLGIAFQIRDDYLDAFGDPAKFGKQVGGDIKKNKKTFLLIHAYSVSSAAQRNELDMLLQQDSPDKVEKTLEIFTACHVDEWALELKNKYFREALEHLDDIAVLSSRKSPLKELAAFLIERDH
ncbi:MAG: polyprenyl synthetase family protein [Terrimonas sp.]|nr:polyprenyl synthetase family protein [Terrimonas sp.]